MSSIKNALELFKNTGGELNPEQYLMVKDTIEIFLKANGIVVKIITLGYDDELDVPKIEMTIQ